MILNKRLRCTDANFYYGTSKCPVSKNQLGENFPFETPSLDNLIEQVELRMGKLSGGHKLYVDSVSADNYRVALSGNGFDVLYEVPNEEN